MIFRSRLLSQAVLSVRPLFMPEEFWRQFRRFLSIVTALCICKYPVFCRGPLLKKTNIIDSKVNFFWSFCGYPSKY